ALAQYETEDRQAAADITVGNEEPVVTELSDGVHRIRSRPESRFHFFRRAVPNGLEHIALHRFGEQEESICVYVCRGRYESGMYVENSHRLRLWQEASRRNRRHPAHSWPLHTPASRHLSLGTNIEGNSETDRNRQIVTVCIR